MFNIEVIEPDRIHLSGRFHAAYVEQAERVFEQVSGSCVVSFAHLDYISSAGLSVLLETQKRLGQEGHTLRLVDMPPFIRSVFIIAGFDAIFDIE